MVFLNPPQKSQPELQTHFAHTSHHHAILQLPVLAEAKKHKHKVHNKQSHQTHRSKMTEAKIRKKLWMASGKDMPVFQGGPPASGFPPVRLARRIPNSALAIFVAAFGAFSWGMYQVGQGNQIRRALKEEKYSAHRAILPVLHAEEDERPLKEEKYAARRAILPVLQAREDERYML